MILIISDNNERTTISYNTVLDTIKVNKNRKSIGLPSIQHSVKIRKDVFKKK